MPLLDLLEHLVFSFELHHIKGDHGLLCPLGVEEAHLVHLRCPLILHLTGNGGALLCCDLNVENRLAVCNHIAYHAGLLGHDCLIGKLPIRHSAVIGRDNPEVSSGGVELSYQLQNLIVDLDIGPVSACNHVPATLVSGLLECGNGGGGSYARPGGASGHVSVAACLLHLVDLHLEDGDGVPVHRVHVYLSDMQVIKTARNGNNPLLPVCEIVIVDCVVVLDKVARPRRHRGIFQDIATESVDVHLRVFANGNKAEAERSPLLRVKHVKNERILSMVVPSDFSPRRVVLSGVNHIVAHELAVVQDCFGADLALVVPIHHHRFVGGVDTLVVLVSGHREGLAAQLAAQVRVLLLQQIRVLEADVEQVPALLDVADSRLPVDVERVNHPDCYVSQPVLCLLVPDDGVHRRAVFELFPPVVRVRLFEVRSLQDARYNVREGLCRLLVGLLPGVNVGLWEIVHRVGVLVGDDVKEPPAGRLHVCPALAPQILPVPQHIPPLVLDNAILQVSLSALVVIEGLHCLAHLLRTNDLLNLRHCHTRCLVHRLTSSCSSHSGLTDAAGGAGPGPAGPKP